MVRTQKTLTDRPGGIYPEFRFAFLFSFLNFFIFLIQSLLALIPVFGSYFRFKPLFLAKRIIYRFQGDNAKYGTLEAFLGIIRQCLLMKIAYRRVHIGRMYGFVVLVFGIKIGKDTASVSEAAERSVSVATNKKCEP